MGFFGGISTYVKGLDHLIKITKSSRFQKSRGMWVVLSPNQDN